METVHDTDVVFETVAETGMRATIGKCMMDAPAPGVPARLQERTEHSIDESLDLHRRWHGTSNGRIRAAFAPRFVLSCTRALLEQVADLSTRERALVHTHASEQRDEIQLVRQQTGAGNVEFLGKVGLLTPRLNVAHCVWVEPEEQAMLAEHDAKVTHCPGSNLKLGSGIAPVPELLKRGVCVSLGSDGAACNNHLDMFDEMRLAAILQASRCGPGTLPARQALWMATRNGARALGLEDEIGSVEVGKRADLILVTRDAPHTAPDPDPWSTIVYAAGPGDVRLAMVDGDVLVRDGTVVRLDGPLLAEDARREAGALAARARL
jgi:5-methylthioadenosine/S-adenosylhomocysteine deaminase